MRDDGAVIAAAQLPRVRADQARVELVGGTRDGERLVLDRVEADNGPAKGQVMPSADGTGHEVYLRRSQAERCEVDGILAWHYDADRGADS